MNNYCKRNHRYYKEFSILPFSQGQEGRHRCAGCAYEKGMKDAISGIPEPKDDSVLIDVEYSQAGVVRHKDAFCAYMAGYKNGLKMKLHPVI